MQLLLFPFMQETQDKKESSAPARDRKDLQLKAFDEIFEAHMERRRQERLREERKQRAEKSDERARENKKQPDYSMYKLYTSLLLRMGGAAPVVDPMSPDATSLANESLKTWRSGSRRMFSRDSDLFSTPRYPITRFE